MQSANDLRVAEMAERALMRNRKKDGPYLYTCPAKGWYDDQWLWDSCFHAIALCAFDPEAAKAELASLMAGQREDGFLPNVIMRDRRNRLKSRLFSLLLFSDGISNLTQPPVVAVALERVYETTHDIAYLREMLPKVARFFDYLHDERDPEKSGLVSIIHPWETGIDSTPSFDVLLHINSVTPTPLSVYAGFYELLASYSFMGWDIKRILRSRRFAVKSVMFNCIYWQGLKTVSKLYAELGDVSRACQYTHLAQATERAILTRFWNKHDGLFYGIAGGRQTRTPTVSSLFPLMLDNIPPEIADQLVYKQLHHPAKFWTPYPLSSVARSHPAFNPKDSKTVLWRGPVWVNANWFLIRALEKHGYDGIAAQLVSRTKALIAKNDALYEFYNPLTGAGEGQKFFSGTALVLDLIDQKLDANSHTVDEPVALPLKHGESRKQHQRA